MSRAVRGVLEATAVGGAAVFAGAWRLAQRPSLHDHEARAMAAMNTHRPVVSGPLRVVMQVGSLGGGLAAAGAVACRGRRRTAALTSGAVLLAWLGAKGVKALTRRGRPADHLENIVIRGRAATGYGFPSGHAAVSMAVASGLSGVLPVPVAVGLGGAAVATGAARMYVGAHLPLDIVGGMGMGLALGCLARLVDEGLARRA